MTNVQYDDDVKDYISENLDYAIEDEGIGYYEYGDGKYTDINYQMRLTTTEIMVQYPCDVEQCIPTLLHGYINGYDNNDYEYEAAWLAELETVTWDHESKTLDATYLISEG